MLVQPANFHLDKLPAFIVIDGVNGAGKSTLQRNMVDYFESKRKHAIATREPGGTSLGKKIREVVLGVNQERPAPMAELFLFAADRAEHVSKIIKPSLAAGKSIISDRYYYSTFAFQGFGRKIDLETINVINRIAIANMLPNLTIILDLEPEVGLRRNSSSAGRALKTDEDAFEHEKLDFQHRMREGFLEAAKIVSEPCVVIDAHKPPLEVFNEIKVILDKSFA